MSTWKMYTSYVDTITAMGRLWPQRILKGGIRGMDVVYCAILAGHVI
jgi:hypothetical protein